MLSSIDRSIERLGSDLVVVATSEDGVIEGVEDPAMRFLVGVQWHPKQGVTGACSKLWFRRPARPSTGFEGAAEVVNFR